jgi:hypothetical protein
MDLSLLTRISQAQFQIIRYEEPIILVLGNLGNVANILIFGRRDLRKNACSWYFICLSVAHLLLLNSFCLSRIIINLTGNNIFNQISSLCKFRAYTNELSLLLSRYFLCLISIDRWMVTSPNAWLRQQSSLHVSRWLIIIGVGFWTIFSVHAPIGFQPTSIDCAPPFGSTYALFYSIESIIVSMTPILIMILSSVWTVFNVHSRVNRQIQPAAPNTCTATERQQTITVNAQSLHQRSRRNIQLVRLSLLQVLLYLLLNSVWSAFPVYTFFTTGPGIISLNQQLTLSFFGRLGLNLLFTYAAVCFFLKTNSNSVIV